MIIPKGWTDPAAPEFPLREIPESSDGLEMLMIGRNDFDLPAPTMPGDEGFEAELMEVQRVGYDVLQGTWPGWYFENHGMQRMVSSLFRQDGSPIRVQSAESAADIVEMDDPQDLGQLMRRWLWAEGIPHRSQDSRGHGNFLERVPFFNYELAKALKASFIEAAQAKAFFGRPRPEEVCGWNLTHYEGGAPKHRSYPAGHGVAAGATFAVIENEYALTRGSEEWELLLNATLQFAHFRTLARVHFANDNTAGVLLGYAKTARLPDVAAASNILNTYL